MSYKEQTTQMRTEAVKKHVFGRVQRLTLAIPAHWEDEAGGSQGQAIETILTNTVKPPSLPKIQKISQAW